MSVLKWLITDGYLCCGSINADGMLYDLNRNELVVLTFLPDPKWVNDYAVSKVIRALKERIDELELKVVV